MPLRERVKSELNIEQLVPERNFSLNDVAAKRPTSRFGLQNHIVRDAYLDERAPTVQQRQKLFSKLGIGTIPSKLL